MQDLNESGQLNQTGMTEIGASGLPAGEDSEALQREMQQAAQLQAALQKEERRRTVRRNRKIVSQVSMGADLYMLAMYAAQYAFLGGAILLSALVTFEDAQFDILDGIAAIASVLFGCILLWQFAARCRERGQLFPEDTVIRTILKREKRVSISSFAAFAAMICLFQFIFSLSLELLEMILNLFDLTIMNSPAMNADYTLSTPLMLYAVFIGPLAEEFVFRGIILKGLRPCGKVFAIVVSALLFSLMHGDIQQLGFTFAAGLVMGYAAMEYSILVSYLIHVVNNGVLSELMLFISEQISENAYMAVSLVMTALSAAYLIWFTIRNRRFLPQYLRANPARPGAVGGLLNIWFLAFVVLCAAETVLTITPM